MAIVVVVVVVAFNGWRYTTATTGTTSSTALIQNGSGVFFSRCCHSILPIGNKMKVKQSSFRPSSYGTKKEGISIVVVVVAAAA